MIFDTCSSLSFLKETNTWSAGQYVRQGVSTSVLEWDSPGMNRVFEFVRCLEMDTSLLLEAEEFLGRMTCGVCSDFLPLPLIESSRSLLDLEMRRGT